MEQRVECNIILIIKSSSLIQRTCLLTYLIFNNLFSNHHDPRGANYYIVEDVNTFSRNSEANASEFLVNHDQCIFVFNVFSNV